MDLPEEFNAVYVYFAVVLLVTTGMVAATALFPSVKKDPGKFMPYESGTRTHTKLLQERVALRHYLVALIFLVIDIEAVFMFPWAAVAKSLGSIAFWEMLGFMAVLTVGFAYVWKKGGLEWE